MKRCSLAFLFVVWAAPLAAQDEEPLDHAATTGPMVALDTGGHTARVLQVFFTADSRELVTVGMDRTMRVWSVADGELKRVLRWPSSSSNLAFAVNPQRTHAAFFVGRGKGIGVLNLNSGDLRVVGQELKDTVNVSSLAFSPDGQQLAAGTNASRVAIIDVHTGKRVGRFATLTPLHLGFTPDGKSITAMRNNLTRFDIATGVLTTIPTAQPNCFAWSPDGAKLLVGKSTGYETWDPSTGKPLKLFVVGETLALTFVRGDRLLTAGKRLSLRNARNGKELVRFNKPGSELPYPRTADLSPDGKWVASSSGPNNDVFIWQASGKPVHTLRGRGTPFFAAGWRGDGQAIAWGDRLLDAGDYTARRPLSRGFDLRELQLLPAEAVKDFRRAVLNLDGAKLIPDAARVDRPGKNVDLGPWTRVSAAPSRGGTLLSRHRAVIGSEIFLFLYDINARGPFDKKANCIRLTGANALNQKKGDATDQLWDVAPSPDERYVLTASRDQTMRVYRVEPKELRLTLSLFVTGPDWVAWTPEGYYAATPGGERLMGWQVDNGPDKLATFYPVNRFRKRLYRPDVIKLVLEKGSATEALQVADAALQQKTEPVAVEAMLPPQATLVVVDRSKLPTVRVKATATARGNGQPVTGLRLLLDGRPLPNREGMAEFAGGKEQADAEWTISLPEGPHRLSVLVRSPDASAISPVIEVRHVNAATQPQLHVLAVGVNDYDDKTLTLKFAAGDAKKIAGAFSKGKDQPYRPGAIVTLLDAQAKKPAVLEALERLRKTAKPNDLVVFFFAGHGVKDQTGFYLLTVEADTSKLAKTTVSGAELRKTLGEFPCQVLAMLDACHSGGAVKAFRPAVDDLTRTLTDDECGVAVLSAAMASELAQEKNGNGLFTRAVVEALETTDGVPFNRHNRLLYVHHLHSFVFDEVARLSGERQHPFLSLPWVVEPFPIRKVVKP